MVTFGGIYLTFNYYFQTPEGVNRSYHGRVLLKQIHKRTGGRPDGGYQAHYLPASLSYAVDKYVEDSNLGSSHTPIM